MVGCFEGKVVVVIGGVSGIGKVVVEIFVCEGVCVVFVDINDNVGYGVVEFLGVDVCIYQYCDVSDESYIKDLIGKMVDCFGWLDILFNNVGVFLGGKEIFDFFLEDWYWVVVINFNFVFYVFKVVIFEMKKGGGGVIINMVLMFGICVDVGFNVYNVIKVVVINYIWILVIDYGKDNICVNVVCLGFIFILMVEGVLVILEME